MANAELKMLLEEMLAPLGPVAIKRMFGGYGLFLDGVMFGLIAGDRLYLKTTEHGRAAFEAEGLGPFTYAKKGGSAVLTSYWAAPDRLLDEADELIEWAREAHRAAIAARSYPSKARRASGKRATSRKPS